MYSPTLPKIAKNSHRLAWDRALKDQQRDLSQRDRTKTPVNGTKAPVILKKMSFLWGEISKYDPYANCGSISQALFKVESDSAGHAAAFCCSHCGQVQQRLSSRHLIELIAGVLA